MLLLALCSLASAKDTDPYAWLEDVTGDRSLEWVAARNAESTSKIEKAPDYGAVHDEIKAILDSDDRIPYVEKMGGYYYNFWQDASHERGVWRRTTLDEYRKAKPAWETVIDLDALDAAEGTAWVWHGANCLDPEYRVCMVALSRGGSDADVKREFSLVDKQFVKDGFAVPEGKSEVSWEDADTLFVGADMGPGTMTTSGYARTIREWKRGTKLEDAPVVFEGQETDVAVSAWRDHTRGYERTFFQRSPTFFTSETTERKADGSKAKLDVPADASAWASREWLFVETRSDWTVGGTTWKAGSLVVAPYDAYLGGDRHLTPLFTPTATTALEGVAITRDHVVLTTLDNVRSRVTVWEHGKDGWTSRPMTGLPEYASIGVGAVDSDESDDVWLSVTDFLTPSTLTLASVDADGPRELLKQLPAQFDASGLEITQHEVTSLDGTKIPYFQVSKKGIALDGKNPTLLYGYGGFEASMTPSYSGTIGTAWLDKGGVYVLANIRGGGEFGPQWHMQAIRENRHKVYEDFAAVARDLAARKVADAAHLGAMGGSNGGLLMGNMIVQYPELFGAIVCQVPLLDMKRYSHLLAGASWMEEYGDPDDPKQWKYLKTFSPYQLETPKGKYPPVLFVTSTRDDRVHPGHARKMAAKMLDQGKDVLYWEDTEGGHGAAATSEERATMWALCWEFLWERLAS